MGAAGGVGRCGQRRVHATRPARFTMTSTCGKHRGSRMNTVYYRAGVAVGKFIFWNCVRLHLIRPEVPERHGPYILALTHLGNLDPFCSSVVVRRRIRWMARKEFFEYR